MENLTDVLQKFGMSKKNAQATLCRVEIYDFARPRNAHIDCVQWNDDNTASIVEIDPSTGRTSNITCKLA